jgi:hypothetical protein
VAGRFLYLLRARRAGGGVGAAGRLRRSGPPGPAGGAEHELLITHNFVIGWFVREALGGPLRPAT